MLLALRLLYTVPIGDHCAVVLRLPCGRSVDLIIFDGSGIATTVCVWQVAGWRGALRDGGRGIGRRRLQQRPIGTK